MSNLNDIAAGKVRRPLGGSSGTSDSDAESGGDFPIKVDLAEGEKLVATFDSVKTVPSTYKDKDGNPQPDVHYYTLTVAEDTGLFSMVTNPETGRKAEEPIAIGEKVSLRGKGDLKDQMAEATPGMLLEIERIGTKITGNGFKFSLYIVSELVADESF